jgi:ABC-type glycerol-3-phosphate transport system substrate-binding protein
MTGRPCRPSNNGRRVTRTLQHRFCLLILALLIGGGLVACGPAPMARPSPPPGATPTATVPVDLPVVIAMAGRFSEKELAVLDEQIATFETANPDVKVEIVEVRRDASQRETMAAWLKNDDTSVDVYVLDNTWLAELASSEGLQPLGDYVESHKVDLDGFFTPAVQADTLEQRLMALPWTVDSGALYYRKDLLAKYGYVPPATWADVQRVALDVKYQAGLPVGFVWQGAAYEPLTCNALEFVWAYGGDVLDEAGNAVFDSPQTLSALTQMREMVTSGASPQDISTYNESSSFQAFENGDAVFLRHWASTWARLQGEDSPLASRVGVAPLPASCLTGRSLALSTFSPNPDQAFRWMAFLAGYEGQVRWAAATGRLPAMEAAYHDAGLLASAPWMEALATVISRARPLPQSAMYPALSEAIYSGVNRLLAGEQDIDTTAGQIQQDIEKALRR